MNWIIVGIFGGIGLIILFQLGIVQEHFFTKRPGRIKPPINVSWHVLGPNYGGRIDYLEIRNGVSFLKLEGVAERIPGVQLWKNLFPLNDEAFIGKSAFVCNVDADGQERAFRDEGLNKLFGNAKRYFKPMREIEATQAVAEDTRARTGESEAIALSRDLDQMHAEKRLKPKTVIQRQSAKRRPRTLEESEGVQATT